MEGFIGLHIGAGDHSLKLYPEYKKLCQAACRKGMSLVRAGSPALQAAVAATAVLEDSALTNAGYGSTLNWEGGVECDASVMDGASLRHGAVGAVPGVRNPVCLAHRLCREQERPTLLGERTPPSMLVGIGARKWAELAGIETVPERSLISARASRRYQHYKKKLEVLGMLKNKVLTPLDTVGTLCVDSEGHVASACSSGGIALKCPGRVGQAGVHGGGCWAQDAEGARPAVAACTSGSGEHLVSTLLAREAARDLMTPLSGSGVVALHDCFRHKFLGSRFLKDVPEDSRLGGAIVVRSCSADGEFLWAHTTNKMVVAFMSAADKKPTVRVSMLPARAQQGRVVSVEGVAFKSPAPAGSGGDSEGELLL
ncbi:threonine aspartase 1 [Bacillus rossius redtenbacheri]|uniref:threonine aspartase 1 n=1 Tax=Bacillus rossius redtenbacheri TaxID=93214 RepID=UPI002FDD4F61